jgi:hypothetical protein
VKALEHVQGLSQKLNPRMPTLVKHCDPDADALKKLTNAVEDMVERLRGMHVTRMCFVAGTPVWTAEGLRAIEMGERIVLASGERVVVQCVTQVSRRCRPERHDPVASRGGCAVGRDHSVGPSRGWFSWLRIRRIMRHGEYHDCFGPE